MPSLSIPFPEGTRTVALRGNNITIGRLPDNAIQIRDRAVSAYHAELIMEGDHYRIHDRSSTNGIQVNGQIVKDFHLREDCQVLLGGLACDFVAAAFPKSSPTDMDTLATRGEMHTVLQANHSLKKEVESLKAQVEAMTSAREAADSKEGGGSSTVPLAQFDQLAADATALRASLQERQTQIERLSGLLAIAQRERDTLQKAYDALRANTPAAAPAPGEAIDISAAPPVVRLAEAASAPAVPTPRPSGIGAPKIPTAPAAKPAIPAALPKPPATLDTPSRRPASGVLPNKTTSTSGPVITAANIRKATQKIAE